MNVGPIDAPAEAEESQPDRAGDRHTRVKTTITAAALDMVLDRGLDAVTVDEIARAANISRRTFFNYFPSKSAACIPDGFPGDREAVRQLLDDTSVPTLTATGRFLWRHVAMAHQNTPEFPRFHELWRREPGIRSDVYAILTKAEGELAVLIARRIGQASDSLVPTTIAAASIAVLRVAVEQWRIDESPVLLETRIREAFEAVAEAMGTPPWVAAGDSA